MFYSSANAAAISASYWLKDKNGLVHKYHSERDEGAIVEFRRELDELTDKLELLGIDFEAPPDDLGLMKAFVEGAERLLAAIEETVVC